MKHAFRLLCLVVAMAVLAACGGGSAATTTTGPDEATTTTVDDDTTTTSDDGEGGTGTPDLTVCGGSDAMNEAMAGYDQALSGAEIDFEEAIAQLHAAADAAPNEIREDFQIVADELEKILLGLAEINLEPGATPTEEQLEALMELGESMDEERFNAAATRLEEWFVENCS
ncbi:MAG TPA: hypothetical protein VF246_01195 [Acidimicrobiia bacterium]